MAFKLRARNSRLRYADNMEGENRGPVRVLAVDLAQISPFQPPRQPSPSALLRSIQGNEVLLFSPISGYICTRLIKYSSSPLLPMGPAILREEGLYDSDRDSPRVAWKPWRWQGVGWWRLSSHGSSLFRFPLLVVRTVSLGRRGLGLLRGLRSGPDGGPPVLERGNVTKVLPSCCLAAATSPERHLGPPRHAERVAHATSGCGCSVPQLTLPGRPRKLGPEQNLGGRRPHRCKLVRTEGTQQPEKALGAVHGQGTSRPVEVVQAGRR